MLPFYLSERPLPLSLFYPQWLLDGPAVVQSWKMSSLISVIEVNLNGAVNTLREESISLMPKKMPGKLGITKKIPSRTLVN
jgi:hypothetical protein